MYDLTDRKTLLASLPQNAICAEIGVDNGLLSKYIIDKCNPHELWLIDNWLYVGEGPYSTDPSNGPSQEYKDKQHVDIVMRYRNDHRVIVQRDSSLVAASQFTTELPDTQRLFDWVYLDANHLEVTADMDAWWPLIKSGGHMMGHDYTIAGEHITVKRDVDVWVARNRLNLLVAGLDSDDIYEQNYPTWLVRKP